MYVDLTHSLSSHLLYKGQVTEYANLRVYVLGGGDMEVYFHCGLNVTTDNDVGLHSGARSSL